MLDPRRAKMVTGSVVGDAIGVGYNSRQKAWRIITGREEREDLSGNPIVQYGIDNEHHGIDACECVTGELLHYNSDDRFFVHPEYDWLGATPDSWGDRLCAQVKCPQNPYEAVKDVHACQVCLEAVLTEKPVMCLTAWHVDKTSVWVSEQVDELWQWMLPHLIEFNEYLETDTEPKRRKKPVLPTIEWKKL